MTRLQKAAYVTDIRARAAKEFGVDYPTKTIKAALALLDSGDPHKTIDDIATARRAVGILYKLVLRQTLIFG